MIAVAYALTLAAGALFFLRLVRGPSLTDRVLSIDGMITSGVAALVVNAYDTDSATYLPVAVVFTLVGFIGTSVVARFIEGQTR